MRTIVETYGVKKNYELTEALKGVSIKVKANEFVTVLGKSGKEYFISYIEWFINS